jgi:hypothetical protein
MHTGNLAKKIAEQDFNVDTFVQMIIQDDSIRDEIIKQLMTHEDIMVYYHAFYIVSHASQERPDLFYKYWPDFASLLNDKNSYHRDFSLTILANLTQVDHPDLFANLFDDYFKHVNDQKFMTARCCIRNIQKIIKNKPALSERIMLILLDVDALCSYSEKQKALLKGDVLEIFDEVYSTVDDKSKMEQFIRLEVDSPSPKTKRKAVQLVGKYNL